MNNIKIMVLGYNDYDEDETVIDFVNTVEEAEDKDDLYHHSYRFVDFIECVEEEGKHFYEEIEYRIGDKIQHS